MQIAAILRACRGGFPTPSHIFSFGSVLIIRLRPRACHQCRCQHHRSVGADPALLASVSPGLDLHLALHPLRTFCAHLGDGVSFSEHRPYRVGPIVRASRYDAALRRRSGRSVPGGTPAGDYGGGRSQYRRWGDPSELRQGAGEKNPWWAFLTAHGGGDVFRAT